MGRADIIMSSSVEVKTANAFSVLQTSSSKKLQQAPLPYPELPKLPVVWKMKPISSWADCEDEDDDEFLSPLPSSLSLPPVKEEKNFEEEEEEEDEEEEKEEKAQQRELNRSSTILLQLVRKPKATATPVPKPTLSKKEQRQHELAELDSVLAELGLLQEMTSTQSHELPIEEKRHHTGRPSQDRPKQTRASTSATEKRCKPKKEKPLVQEEAEVVEGIKGAIDHTALRKVAASVRSEKGKKRSNGCTVASVSPPCKAAVAEASARAAKVAAAKRRERSKQQNHCH